MHIFKRLPSFLLISACGLAIFLANSSVADWYINVLKKPLLIIPKNTFFVPINTSFIVNEVFMVFFFLLVSVEIKQGFFHQKFNTFKELSLPFYAALGGIVMPALFYYLCNFNTPTSVGLAIPTTTDIALSLGVLTLLKKPVSSTLKLFLTTLAVFDDLCAIIIIAFLYTNHIASFWIMLGTVPFGMLLCLNRKKIALWWPYLCCALLLWWCVLQSGVHATIAGVLIGLLIPSYPLANKSVAATIQVEELLKPWVDYMILPAFALVNAGFVFKNLSIQYLCHPVFLGIFLGLVIGKPLGILGATHLALKTGIAQWPGKIIDWFAMIGIACLGGIGFTMSLLMALLAFPEGRILELARQSILAASLVSAGLGYVILQFYSSHKQLSVTR